MKGEVGIWGWMATIEWRAVSVGGPRGAVRRKRQRPGKLPPPELRSSKSARAPEQAGTRNGWGAVGRRVDPRFSSTSAHIPTKMSNQIDKVNDNSSQLDSWLDRSLRSIAVCCCTDASSVERPTGLSMSQIMTNSGEGNRQLQRLVIWLEKYAIRQWKVADRNALGDNFDHAFERYLTDLDCPTEYMYRTRDGSGCEEDNDTHWRTNPQSRGKIVFWVVSTAISELYADQTPMDGNSDKVSQQPQAEQEADTKPDLNNIIIDKDSFPLGFSTDDADMDGILMALRMKYLLDLRQVQNKVNESVAEMQKLTVKR